MIFSFARHAMLHLMHKAHSRPGNVHEDYQSWIRAMISESENISSNYRASCFLCGCYFAIAIKTELAQRFEPLMRSVLSLMIGGWAGAKFYLLFLIASNGDLTKSALLLFVLIGLLIVTALAYFSCAVSFFKKQHSSFICGLIITLMSNLLLFVVIQLDMYIFDFKVNITNAWYLAIICEEYFVWSMIMLSAIFVTLFKYLPFSDEQA